MATDEQLIKQIQQGKGRPLKVRIFSVNSALKMKQIRKYGEVKHDG